MRGDNVERRVQGRGEAGEVGTEEGRSRGLERLDAVVLGTRARRDGGGVRAKEVLVEPDRARGVVDRDIEVTTAAGLGDEALDATAGRVGVLGGPERGEANDALDLEGLVDLGELLEEAGEDNLLEGGDVAGGRGLEREGGEDGLDLGGDGEGVEVDLEDLVEAEELRADALEDLAVDLGTRNDQNRFQARDRG